MQKYIGIKLVDAEPMRLDDYNTYRGWTIPEDEDPTEAGMLVKDQTGRESWVPEDVFNKTYSKKTSGMSFGMAIQMMKSGRKVARAGWNGPGQYIVYQKGYPEGIPINKNTSEAIGQPEGTVCRFAPYLMIRTTDNWFVPWLASQTDMLAEDWMIVE